MVYLKCSKCGNKWNYKGKNSVNASCTDCRHLVNIKCQMTNSKFNKLSYIFMKINNKYYNYFNVIKKITILTAILRGIYGIFKMS